MWLQSFNVHRGGGSYPFNYTLNIKGPELPLILAIAATAEYLPIKRRRTCQHCVFNPYQGSAHPQVQDDALSIPLCVYLYTYRCTYKVGVCAIYVHL